MQNQITTHPSAAPGVAETVLNEQAVKPKWRLSAVFTRKPKPVKQPVGQTPAPTPAPSPLPAQAPIQPANRSALVVLQPQSPRTLKTTAGAVFESLITWAWTKRLLYWIVMSAGTASELVFLISAIWVSVNANVHPFVLTYLTEKQTEYFTYLATTGFVALPECIVGLAMITTIGHIKMWRVGGSSSVLWSILFGVPTLIFLVLSLVTIGCSVANVTFVMPVFFVVVRALAAFIFAFSAFMYEFLGKPQERERLLEKDGMIAGLQAEMKGSLESLQANMVDALASLTREKDGLLGTVTREKDVLLATLRAEKDGLLAALTREKQTILVNAAQEKDVLLAKIDVQTDEIESLKNLLAQTQKGFSDLYKAVNKSDEDALQAYSGECKTWILSGVKSVSPEEITRYTGHSNRKINNALSSGKLKRPANNKGDKILILVSSLLEWLEQNPPATERHTDKIPALNLTNYADLAASAD